MELTDDEQAPDTATEHDQAPHSATKDEPEPIVIGEKISPFSVLIGYKTGLHIHVFFLQSLLQIQTWLTKTIIGYSRHWGSYSMILSRCHPFLPYQVTSCLDSLQFFWCWCWCWCLGLLTIFSYLFYFSFHCSFQSFLLLLKT